MIISQKKVNIIIVIIATVCLWSCRKQLDAKPDKFLIDEKVLQGYDNLLKATQGAYQLLFYNDYPFMAAYNSLAELSTDNVQVLRREDNDEFGIAASYNYQHTANMKLIDTVWSNGYKIIYQANKVINAIPDNSEEKLRQLKGECLFLRAFAHFQLVKLFARPFVQNNGNNPGVPYLTKTDPFAKPLRNTVAQVYDSIIGDASKAALLMRLTRNGNATATKSAALALLSSVYLNRGDNVNCIRFADSVILNTNFSLTDTAAYRNYFKTNHATNTETIFCLRSDSMQQTGIFYHANYLDRYAAASTNFTQLIAQVTADKRQAFINRVFVAGSGNRFFTNKYDGQNGNRTVFTLPIIRLAEMYANRAEAYAKLGNNIEVCNNVNILRRRAGIVAAADLYTPTQLRGRANFLVVALEERRLEFSFELGMRRDDLLRNGLSMIRNYTPATIPGNVLTILPASNRIIYPIPQSEMNLNGNMVQNAF
jgi:starch-binding outer membrane protein, SusD/RagB family